MWSHQASFRLEKYVGWGWPDQSGVTHKGGEFKAADKLALATLRFLRRQNRVSLAASTRKCRALRPTAV